MRDDAKGDALKLRLSATEHDLFKRAAKAEGLGLSAWMRFHLLRVAKRKLAHEGGSPERSE